jgi:hypothetical protein
MDPLAALLSNTLSHDNAVSKAAATKLRELEPSPEFGVLLLRVAGAASMDLVIRQSAATLFKNLVRRQWVRGLASTVAAAAARARARCARRPRCACARALLSSRRPTRALA